MTGGYWEARELAAKGLGWEDIRARLPVSTFEARAAVFGKLAARRMEDRDLSRQVSWRLRSTTRKLEAS